MSANPLQLQPHSRKAPVPGSGPAPRTSTSELVDTLAHMLAVELSVHHHAQRPGRAEALGLPLTDYCTLELIIGFGQLSTGQITRLTGLSTGGTTAMLNRLEHAGYIRRERHPDDRRVVIVEPVWPRCEPILDRPTRTLTEILHDAARHNPASVVPAHDLLKTCVQALARQNAGWLSAHGPGLQP